MSVFDEFLDKDSGRNKTIVISIALVVIAAVLTASIYFINRNKFEVLFFNMDAADIQTVTTELDSLGVRYEVDDSSILVAGKDVDRIRKKMANNSLLLKKSLGFEIFDDSEFGITEFAQQINYQRAMQGELSRTIMAIDGIKHARVHLVMPEDGLFQQDRKKPSASITVFVEDGYKLPKRQIIGIQQLVSSSIEGMEMDRVSIINNHGLILSKSELNSADKILSSQLAKKIEMESYMQGKILKILAKAIGGDCCVANVDVEMDFRTVTKTREEIIPQDSSRAGIIKERILKPGAKNKSKKKPIATDVEYKLGREISQIIESPGRVVRVGVGIVVPNYVSTENQDKIRKLAISSLGLNLKRGDTIAVTGTFIDKPTSMKASNDSIIPVMEEPFDDAPMIEMKSITAPAMDMKVANPSFASEMKMLFELSAYQLGGILVFTLLCIFIALITFYLFFIKNGSNNKKLTAIEREKVLKQVTNWLNSESDVIPAEAVQK